MCARGELFCGEGRRASRVGHRRHVDESRAAGKRRGRHFAGRRRRRTSTGIVCREKRERERERERREREEGGADREKNRGRSSGGHSRAFGCLYIFRFQPTRVAACLVAVPGSTFLRHVCLLFPYGAYLASLASLSHPGAFVLRIIAAMDRKQTRNPLVTGTRHPPRGVFGVFKIYPRAKATTTMMSRSLEFLARKIHPACIPFGSKSRFRSGQSIGRRLQHRCRPSITNYAIESITFSISRFSENRPLDPTTRRHSVIPARVGRVPHRTLRSRRRGMGRDVLSLPTLPLLPQQLEIAPRSAAAGPVHQAKVERPISGTRCQNIHSHPVTLRVRLGVPSPLPPPIWRPARPRARALGESVKRVALPAVHHSRSRTSATTKDVAEEDESARRDATVAAAHNISV